MGKHITKIFRIILLAVSVIGFCVSYLLYQKWSIIYFGDIDGEFIESIGGPYWIASYMMIGFAVLFITVLGWIVVAHILRRKANAHE